MTQKSSPASSRAQLRRQALSRWENEGGATAHRLVDDGAVDPLLADLPPLTNAELVQLRIRVIALENLVISLLLQADAGCADQVREMATYISPREGFTAHPLTLRAATQMESLVDRAQNYRSSYGG